MNEITTKINGINVKITSNTPSDEAIEEFNRQLNQEVQSAK